jgi:epoxyqueuosine reductase
LRAIPSGRGDPKVLWPEVRSILVLGANYAPAQDPRMALAAKDRGAISVYAQGDDYHDLMKTRAKHLARELAERYSIEVKVFVDTAPVMEKPAAMRAGLGWQASIRIWSAVPLAPGCFSPRCSSRWTCLPDEPETDHCGSCSRCIEVCPDQSDHRPLPHRCARLPLLSHHRAQGADPASISRCLRQPHLRVR